MKKAPSKASPAEGFHLSKRTSRRMSGGLSSPEGVDIRGRTLYITEKMIAVWRAALSRFTLILSVLLSSLVAQQVMASSLDPDIEYANLSREVESRLLNGEFAALDSMAEQQRNQKSRFADGRWKLTAFYDGMHPDDDDKESLWPTYERQLKRWVESAGARSPTPHVALASFYVSRGWHARGTGYAEEVSPEGWQAFRKDLALARSVLTDSAPISKRCPQWFEEMQGVALGQGWTTSDYEALFEEAVSREPTYYFYYFEKASFYQSRWYGNRAMLKAFVDDAVARTYKSEGLTLYARIYWSSEREFGSQMFAPGNVDWTKMKAGFEFMETRYPESNWNRNAFAHFACLARDKTTTKRTLDLIGEHIAYGAWNSSQEVEYCQRWSSYRSVERLGSAGG
jgi:hypothetical protein